LKENDQPLNRPPSESEKDGEELRGSRFLDLVKRLAVLILSRFPKWLGSRAWRLLRCCAAPTWRVLRRCVIPVCCFILCVGVLFFALVCAVSAAVCHKTGDRILSIEQLSEMEGEFDCILVLGCRVYSDGTPSPMLGDRISTAVTLYQNNISKRILMSGDSRSVWYDETGAMRTAAIAMGIPEAAIQTDPMGLSTYDSIARYLEIWKGKRVVIVTQEYHLYRALYIAEKLGIEAYGVSADQRTYAGQIKYDLREIFARCKDVFYALKKPTAAGLADLPR